MESSLNREMKLLHVLLKLLPKVNALPFGWGMFVLEFPSFLLVTRDGYDVGPLGYAA